MTLWRRVVSWFGRRSKARAAALLLPGTGWLIAFFLVPILLMLGYSLMQRDPYGGVAPGLTFEHYRRFFDPLYLQVLWRTILWSVVCTAVCLVLGYPVAYLIAR